MSPEVSGRSRKRQPYRYVSGTPKFDLLCERARLDPAIYAEKEFLAVKGMSALYELFSDGELFVGSPVQALTALSRSAKTEADARHGDFYTAMADLKELAAADSDQDLTDEVNRLARFSGEVLAAQEAAGLLAIPGTSQVEVELTHSGELSIRFAGYDWKPETEIPIILEFGPGIVGKRFIDAQIDSMIARQNLPAFQYLPVSDGPFVNEYLLAYSRSRLKAKLGEQYSGVLRTSDMLIGCEDGMLQATEAILGSAPPRPIDLVIMCGLQNADPADFKETLGLLPGLMGGCSKLLLSSPVHKLTDGMVTFAEQLRFAQEAGLGVDWQATTSSGNARLGTNTLSGCAVLSIPAGQEE